ncbi:hypothetical protein, partial [Nostocoides japonicum]|uniref:hypothetical protein n=1 Tax=Nostocoides japonicum TaxID=99481 RepID=UPI001F1A6357
MRWVRVVALTAGVVSLVPLVGSPALATTPDVAAVSQLSAVPDKGKPIPSKQQVEAARKAAAAAAARVKQVQAAYQAASARLIALQAEVSAAAAAYGQAAALLQVRTATAQAAQSDAESAERDADTAELAVRQDASLAYQEGGSFGTMGALLRSDGPQDLLDLATVVDAISERRNENLAKASAAAQVAAGARAVAQRAREQQQEAADAAKAAL